MAAPRRQGSRTTTRTDAVHPAPVPPSRDLRRLAEAAARCQACPLWKLGTQTVFGSGPRARLLFLGEQPGDQEDRAGIPFVGPAGRMLDRALADAGIDRSAIYLTNAVKHFKWEPRGPRRLHKKPGAREIAACRPWLIAEIEAVDPELIVCLGATAAHAVFGRPIRILAERGSVRGTPLGPPALLTVHPSSLLRVVDREQAAEAYAAFVEDLRSVAHRDPGGAAVSRSIDPAGPRTQAAARPAAPARTRIGTTVRSAAANRRS